jgi:hypothetical protein
LLAVELVVELHTEEVVELGVTDLQFLVSLLEEVHQLKVHCKLLLALLTL